MQRISNLWGKTFNSFKFLKIANSCLSLSIYAVNLPFLQQVLRQILDSNTKTVCFYTKYTNHKKVQTKTFCNAPQLCNVYTGKSVYQNCHKMLHLGFIDLVCILATHMLATLFLSRLSGPFEKTFWMGAVSHLLQTTTTFYMSSLFTQHQKGENVNWINNVGNFKTLIHM